ncbi:MAG: acyl-protein synthetase [Ruminococcaceae bacterium]|nr:acyl-protein synthetase [Oscillospiraceae bacterium]
MIEDFYNHGVYSLSRSEKDRLITGELVALTEHHRENCAAYAGMLKTLNYDADRVMHASDIPFIPVRLFKELELMSIPRESVFKTMTSSGTTNQAVSRIYVDRETAMMQQKVLIRILGDFLGKQRLPILVIDSPAVMKDRIQFSARGAAIIGLQVMAREMVFVLNEDMSLDEAALMRFLEKYGHTKFLIFGFTFMVWQHLYEAVQQNGRGYDLSAGWLMTGGGWKKLISDSVTQEEFRRRMTETFGIIHFLDHYGMVEQTGCIYAECECHHLHASIFSDVFVRRPDDFSLCGNGEAGILQTVSVLPHSYPGHSLLTEDRGIILGEDDCPCGRKGKYIQILGRIQSAELRGCSDTYAEMLK